MERIGGIWRRIRMFFQGERFNRELDEEMRFHRELREREYRVDTKMAKNARNLGPQRFGNTLQWREESQEMWGWTWLENFAHDIRFGARTLRKNPGFTAIAVLTIALGIGANTAIFSIINDQLLQQLPFPQPDRVMIIHRGEGSSIPYAEYLDLQAQSQSFELLGLQRRDNMNLTGAGDPERVVVRMCSPDYLTILGIQPLLGRGFTKEEDHLGAAPVVLLSESLWREKYSSDPKAVGSTATLSGKDYAIIGVVPDLPKQFARTDVFISIGQWSEPAFRVRGSGFGSIGMARLKPGVTLAQARADMKHLAANLSSAYPKEDSELSFSVVPFRTDTQGTLQQTLLLLSGAVLFVLLIACANVANLLLARASGRGRELAIRAALGAPRNRIVRQLMTETSLIGVLGGGLGLLLAEWGIQGLQAISPRLTFGVGPGVNLRVLLFTLALSLLTGVLFGVVPALRAARVDVQETLKKGGRGTTGGHQRAQSVLVISEIALAMVLLTGAGLLIRSLTRVWQVNPGFDARNILSFVVAPSPEAATNPTKLRQTYLRLVVGLGAVPGAEAASVAFGNLPMTGDSDIVFWREDRPKPEKLTDAPDSLWYAVTPDYLRVLKIPLLRGRFIEPRDTEDAPPVAAINEDIARELFPGEDPVGKRLRLTFFDETVEIVGIVGNVKHFGLDTQAKDDNQKQFYISFRQVPDRLMPLLAKNSRIAMRSAGAPGAMTDAVRRVVRAVDNHQVMFGEITMQELLDGTLAFRRSSTIMLEIFAGLALLLASIGIYGVISNLVGQRIHEVGLRMALGAQRGDILRLVLGRAIRLNVIGIVLGIAAALPLTRLLASQLFGIEASDPLTFAGVALILTSVALLASYLPARRATKVDPIVALRYE